eukprot:scaffold16853_cov105-Skeletonema_dohrnii-CCMP3373.AAC.1
MYNASLAVYYVLVIVKKKSDNQIARIEPWLHANAIAWGLGTGIGGLSLEIFNQVGWDCWISAKPLGCKETWTLKEGEVGTCERGDNGSLYQWAFYYAPLWFVIVFVSLLIPLIVFVSLLINWVYAHVRNQEKQMNKYAGSIDRREQQSQHERVRTQAFMYVGAFLITWLFPTLFQLVIVIGGKFPFPLLLLTATFVPIQGLLNLIVLIRPKFVRYKNKNPDTNMIVVVAWFRMLYLEVTGNVQPTPSRTTATSTSTPQQNNSRFDRQNTFRLTVFKPMSSSLSGTKKSGLGLGDSEKKSGLGDIEEEKEEEDSSMEDEEFEDNPKQTYNEDISP